MSSSFLGDLVNGVFSESSNVSFTAFVTSGIVAITVVQQEFGVTIAVSSCSVEIHNEVDVTSCKCIDYWTCGLCFLTG